MPRDGLGIFSAPPGTTATTLTPINSAAYNTFVADLVMDANAARPVVAGGTGATTASGARTALGVQQLNANLTSLSGLTLAADRGLYSTGADTLALFTLTQAGRALLDDPDAAAQRLTLGLNNVDNTSDANKPVSTAQQAAIDALTTLYPPAPTWQNVTASRSRNTAYQNTTGYMLDFTVRDGAAPTGNSGNMQVSADNVTWITLGASSFDSGVSSNLRLAGQVVIPVPTGSYYRYTCNVNPDFWGELR